MPKAAPLFLALFAASCTHITHPAHVDEGLRLALLGGLGSEARSFGANGETQDTRLIGDVQVDVGYGWRFDPDLALLLSLSVPFLGRDNNKQSFILPVHSSIDLYLQCLGEPLDAGIGLIIAAAPGLYGMLGERFEITNDLSLSLDFALKAGLYQEAEERPRFPSITPTLLAGLGGSGWRAFLFADATVYPATADRELLEGDDPVAYLYMVGAGFELTLLRPSER